MNEQRDQADSMERERRIVPTGRVELRQGNDGETVLEGMAPPWESWSKNLGGFREIFERGAFANLSEGGELADPEDMVTSTFEHNSAMLLGTTPTNLRLQDQEKGLAYTVALPDTTAGRDAAEYVRRGDVRGSSFEFSVLPEGSKWSPGEDGVMERRVKAGGAILYQVGPVTNPAYADTAAAMRQLRALRSSEGEQETKSAPKAAPEGEERGRLIVGMSDQDRREALRLALSEMEAESDHLWPEAVYEREVVYEMKTKDGDWRYFVRSYEMGEDGEAQVGDEREPVRRNISYEVLDEDGAAMRTVGETGDGEERSEDGEGDGGDLSDLEHRLRGMQARM